MTLNQDRKLQIFCAALQAAAAVGVKAGSSHEASDIVNRAILIAKQAVQKLERESLDR